MHLEGQLAGDGLERGDHLVGVDTGGLAELGGLRLLERDVQALRDGLRVVVPAERDVAREDRYAAPDHVRLHDRRADVDEGDRVGSAVGGVQLVLVLQSEPVEVHDHWGDLGLFGDGEVLGDLGLLHRDQDQVHVGVGLPDDLVVEEHLVNREGDVVLGLELDGVGDLLGRGLREQDLLDDDLAARHRDRRVPRLDTGFRDGFLDRPHDDGRVLDDALRDGVGRQRDDRIRIQFEVPAGPLELDYLDGAGTDVQPSVVPTRFSYSLSFPNQPMSQKSS